MTILMDDLRSLYNDLTTFNEETILNKFPTPIQVQFDKDYNSLRFEQKGKTVYTRIPVYYSLGLWEDLQDPTWLTPEGYEELMSSLQYVIADKSGYLLESRTCLSPENYGFDIWGEELREPWKGPNLLASIRFVSGTSWLFKWWVSRKYKVKLSNIKKRK